MTSLFKSRDWDMFELETLIIDVAIDKKVC